MFILVAPQNAVGNCIIDVRTPMTKKTGFSYIFRNNFMTLDCRI